MGMGQGEVSREGVFGAAGLSLIATVGQCFTTDRFCNHYNWLWLTMYCLAVVTLSAAIVDFDPKRWLR